MSTYDQSTVHGWFPRLEYESWIQPVESNSSKHEAIDSTFPNSDTPFEGYVIYIYTCCTYIVLRDIPAFCHTSFLYNVRDGTCPNLLMSFSCTLSFRDCSYYDILYTEYPLVIKRVKLGNPRTKWNCSWEKTTHRTKGNCPERHL